MSEVSHRGLACRRVAVRRRAVLVVAESERPYPRGANRRCSGLEVAADHSAIGEHVEVVIIPLAGGTEAEARLRIRGLRQGKTLYDRTSVFLPRCLQLKAIFLSASRLSSQ
jgi:hypothetical protein